MDPFPVVSNDSEKPPNYQCLMAKALKGTWRARDHNCLVHCSLVITLPKTKKGKYTAVTEAHKEYT